MTSPSPVSGATAWAGLEDIPAGVAELRSGPEWAAHLSTATDILWAATMRRWRGDTLTETVTLRAAPSRQAGGWAYDRSWGHCPCCAGVTALGLPRWGSGAHRHVAPYRVRLPRPDVVDVTEVLVDGAAFTGWELDGSWLARTDDRPWRVCGDRTEVTYTFGRPPPEGGKAAVIELAVELARSAAGDGTDQACRLPQRMQSVSRQGLTYEALADLDFLDAGLTGLTGPDMWIKSVNPSGRTQEAAVWTPDAPKARRKRGSNP